MILLGSQNCDLRVTDAADEDDEDELKRAAHVGLCVVAGRASASLRPRGTPILLL